MGRPLEQLDPESRIQVHQLKSHHRSMARDLVAGGLQNYQVAKLYGMTETQISIIKNSPAFIAEMARLETQLEESVVEIKGRLLALAPQATRVLARNIYDESDDINVRRLASKSAVDVLEKVVPTRDAGSGNTYNVLTNIDARNLTTEALRDDIFELIRDESS